MTDLRKFRINDQVKLNGDIFHPLALGKIGTITKIQDSSIIIGDIAETEFTQEVKVKEAHDNLEYISKGEKTFICSDCDDEHSIDDSHTIDDNLVCDSCFEDNYFYCDKCGTVHGIDEIKEINTYSGHFHYCEDCFNDNYIHCEDCGDTTPRDESYTSRNDDYDYCNTCFNDRYGYCDDCGEEHYRDDLSYEDDYMYCENCKPTHLIRSYDYRPNPEFNGVPTPNNPYIGYELELEFDGADSTEAAEIALEMNQVYLKRDGSISDGMEIVSHPATFEWHSNQNYDIYLKQLSNLGCQSHNTSTCGIHFHISRQFLDDQKISKILYFMAEHQEKIEILARRNSEEWAKFPEKKALVDQKPNHQRYSAVNTNPRETIEFRIFKGTLKYSTFMANMELVLMIHNFCCKKGVGQRKLSIWSDFLKFIVNSETKFLEDYMMKQQLMYSDFPKKETPKYETEKEKRIKEATRREEMRIAERAIRENSQSTISGSILTFDEYQVGDRIRLTTVQVPEYGEQYYDNNLGYSDHSENLNNTGVITNINSNHFDIKWDENERNEYSRRSSLTYPEMIERISISTTRQSGEFLIGDIVTLIADHNYSRCMENPIGIEGEIYEIGSFIVVEWANGTTNTYTTRDLLLVGQNEENIDNSATVAQMRAIHNQRRERAELRNDSGHHLSDIHSQRSQQILRRG